jgi:predicted ABC-type ATPase
MHSPSTAPQAIILAGPNGAGKTTAAPVLLRDELHVPTYVNADVIAQGLSGFAPESADREAGEILLRRLDQLQAHRASFAFETTLSGRGHARRVRDLIRDGYAVHLLYIWLPDAEHAVARVRLRVMHGGHAVPEETIRRRYNRSLHNLSNLYMPLASTWRVYDGRGFAQGHGVPLIAHGGLNRTARIQDDQAWKLVTGQLSTIRRGEPK